VLQATIAAAPVNHFDHLSRLIWKGHAAGALDEASGCWSAEVSKEATADHQINSDHLSAGDVMP
jgi:hypothetical protein